MGASLRNFFITFVLSLLLFGGLAYSYYGDLEALLPLSKENVSGEESDVSGGMSDNTSSTEIILPPEDTGDGLGTINGLVVTKGVKGNVLSVSFLRINSNNKRVITCDLSLTASLYNNVGALVPLQDYLYLYSGEQAAQAICALTGFSADFYLVLTPDSIDEMAANLSGASYPLRQQINYVNPKYDGVTYPDGEPLPLDYYQEIKAGTNILESDTLSRIFGEYADCYDGSQGPSPDSIVSELYDYFITQLTGIRRADMQKDLDRLSRVFSGAETNMTSGFLNEYAKLLFKYGEYPVVDVAYTTRDATLHNLKEADQKVIAQ